MHSWQDWVFLSLRCSLGQSAAGKMLQKILRRLGGWAQFQNCLLSRADDWVRQQATFPYLANTLWPCHTAVISATFSAILLELKSDSWDKSFLAVCGRFLPQMTYRTDTYGTFHSRIRWLAVLIWCSHIWSRCLSNFYLRKLWAYRLVKCRLLDLLMMRRTVRLPVCFYCSTVVVWVKSFQANLLFSGSCRSHFGPMWTRSPSSAGLVAVLCDD